MASMRGIKRRKEGIQNTQQITKAMKLVATVKLQKSRAKAENSKPYVTMMHQTIIAMLNRSGTVRHRYLSAGNSRKQAVIAITSNRGLAGGYNHNIVRLVTAKSSLSPSDTLIYAIGRKGKDSFLRKGYTIAEDYSEVANEPIYQDAADITAELLDAYLHNRIGEIYLAYTSFKTTVTHHPVLIKLLPVDVDMAGGLENQATMNYEPEEDEVLDLIIPKYISSLIYGALLESAASEHGARMTAMDSATSNADEMIGDLELLYNRARQDSITQELTEIIAGVNAIS